MDKIDHTSVLIENSHSLAVGDLPNYNFKYLSRSNRGFPKLRLSQIELIELIEQI